MVPVNCARCGDKGMIWDEGWVRHRGVLGPSSDYYFCPECTKASTLPELPQEVAASIEEHRENLLAISAQSYPPLSQEHAVMADRLKQRHAERVKKQRLERRKRFFDEMKKDPEGFERALDEVFARKDEEHPLQKEFGFTVPEDGSEERYQERRKKYNVPWTTHTFYWVIHNAVAHPLIGVCPIKPFFKLHDWTSRKMHGK